MRVLIPIDRSRPLGDQVYLHLRQAVLSGALRRGDRLPSTRDLAVRLSMARNTVVAAYARLRAEGYVVGMRSGGTRVSDALPRGGMRLSPAPGHAPAPRSRPREGRGKHPRLSAYGRRVQDHPDIFPPAVRVDRSRLTWDFDYNVNLSDAASRRAWGRLLRRASARHEAAPARYDFGQRPGALQESLTRYLALTRGIHVSPAQIIVTNTYQHAFDLAARLFLEPGDAVVVEDPHALRMRHALLAGGARLIAIPGDDDGMRTDALARFRGPRARLAYTASSCSWVTMATLPLARRLELLAWARQADAWIIENDHNGEYVYQGTPIQPLQALDRDGRVIFMGTFSRLLHPDPLIGFLVVPEWLAGAFHAAALVDGAHASPVDTEVLARFIDSGEMESLVRRTTRRLRELRRALLDALENAEGITTRVRETRGGVHVHVRLPKVRPGDLDALVARAAKAGVGVFPDRPYYLRAPGVAGLMMGFAALSPALIGAGVARLAEVIRNFERDAQPR